jgi:linoleoyl-CoA desaturase
VGWAQKQVETAASYGEHSWFWFIMSGYTNLQVRGVLPWSGACRVVSYHPLGGAWAEALAVLVRVQIGHHLFPGLCHEKVWAVCPLIKETCREFGIQYQEYRHLWGMVYQGEVYFAGLAGPGGSDGKAKDE